MPAMVVNDYSICLEKYGVLTFFAGKPAPTEIRRQKKVRPSRIAPFLLRLGYQLPSAFDANQNNPADKPTVAGRVSTQAIRMVFTVPP